MEDIKVDAYRGFQATNNFIYKGKRYPFNIAIFNCFSQYFTSNQIIIEPNSDIKLLDDTEDDTTVTDESIKDFINHCHNQHIYLTKKNVPALYKLSKKYNVPSLIESTEDFINIHKKEFVIEYLIMNQNRQDFKQEEYEEMISKSIQDYIDDDRLLSLPIASLHRILRHYLQLNINSIKPSKLFEFLFKCLDKLGRSASVLFDHVDFGNATGEVIKRLIDEYSEKFDFHFINGNQLKTVYMLECSLIEREEKIRQQQEEMKKEGRTKEEQIRQKQDELAAEVAQMKELVKQTQSEMRAEIDRVGQLCGEQMKQKQDELATEVAQLKGLIRQTQSEMRAEIDRVGQLCGEQISQLREHVTRQSESFRDQMKAANKQIDDLKNCPVVCRFSSESDTSGALSLLKDGVKLTGGGSINSNYPLDNLRIYNNGYFFNYDCLIPKSESEGYIKFDFGPSKKIDLHSYFIRSNSNNENYIHPKTWRIEGSNDDTHWTKLDWRDDDQNLRGPFKQHHFECKTREHGSENNRYRYIRYLQLNSWYSSSGYQYGIYLTYFELYGDIYG